MQANFVYKKSNDSIFAMSKFGSPNIENPGPRGVALHVLLLSHEFVPALHRMYGKQLIVVLDFPGGGGIAMAYIRSLACMMINRVPNVRIGQTSDFHDPSLNRVVCV
jgi:hypothetical protein